MPEDNAHAHGGKNPDRKISIQKRHVFGNCPPRSLSAHAISEAVVRRSVSGMELPKECSAHKSTTLAAADFSEIRGENAFQVFGVRQCFLRSGDGFVNPREG